MPIGIPKAEAIINLKVIFQLIEVLCLINKISASVNPFKVINGVAVFIPKIIDKKGMANIASPKPNVA